MGGVIGGIASYENNSAKASAETYNAAVARWQAGDALIRGEVAASEMKSRGAMIKAAGLTAAGHGNIDTQTGSATSVREGTAAMTQLDVERIKNNALRTAFGYKVAAYNHKAAAAAAQNSADWALVGSVVSMASTGMSFQGAMGPGAGTPVIGSGVTPDVNEGLARPPTIDEMG